MPIQKPTMVCVRAKDALDGNFWRSWSRTGPRARAADLAPKGIIDELEVERCKFERLTRQRNFIHTASPLQASCDRLNGTVVGQLGEVHPQLFRAYKIKVRPCYLELEAVLSKGDVACSYKSAPQHQDLERTITFALPLLVHSEAVVRSYLTWAKVSIVDRFDFQDDGQPKER